MTKRFFGIWNDVTDVEDSFELPGGGLAGFDVLFAWYGYESYSGQAQVIYLDQDGDLYEVTASHCSCYGLEDSWSPGHTSWEALAMRPDPTTDRWSEDMCLEAREALSKLYKGERP